MRNTKYYRSWIVQSLVIPLTIVVGLIWLPHAARAEAEKRVAFVIGNGDYKAAPKLDNPPGDARAVAASLRRLGFEVFDGYDLTIAEMRSKLAEFSAALPDAKAALVYYAGHGVSVDEENYMLPTDIVLKSPTDLDINAINVSLVMKQLKREERVNVVILDACRDNPFAADLARNKTRAIVGERGLSPIDGELARGTLIAFASDPKSTALDGTAGENSPFTRALLDHIEDPDVPIDTVMNRVRTEVWAATKHKQLPWVNTSIIGEFRLNPNAAANRTQALLAPPADAVPAQQANLAQENLLWASAQQSNLAADYAAYLDSYPHGIYAAMAHNRIASLSPTPPSATPPAVQNPADAAPAIAPAALKAEVGTMASEKSLGLTVEQRKEIQQRLIVLEFDAGPVTGTFGTQTRAAIADWQTHHAVAPTTWLGPVQYAALKAESESQFQRFTIAQAMSPAVTRSLQPPKKLPVRKLVQVVHKPRAVNAHPAAAEAGSSAVGSFLGGVASGLMKSMINH